MAERLEKYKLGVLAIFTLGRKWMNAVAWVAGGKAELKRVSPHYGRDGSTAARDGRFHCKPQGSAGAEGMAASTRQQQRLERLRAINALSTLLPAEERHAMGLNSMGRVVRWQDEDEELILGPKQ
jgi:hypothetical protein